MYGICNGYRDRLVALEQIMIEIGFRPTIKLRREYTKRWHDKKIMDLSIEGGFFPS